MPQLKTRKQLRIEGQSHAAELAEIKSPEGLARYMFSRQRDQEFEDRFRAEIEKLAKENHDRLRAEEAASESEQVMSSESEHDSQLTTLPSRPTTKRPVSSRVATASCTKRPTASCRCS